MSMKKRVKIMDTTLRDGHQSLWATRMTTEEMLPIAEKMDQVGYWSMEVWGGATFDAPLRFLNEDPWDRLYQLKRRIKKTRLQMLLRGQNIVGYKNYRLFTCILALNKHLYCIFICHKDITYSYILFICFFRDITNDSYKLANISVELNTVSFLILLLVNLK